MKIVVAPRYKDLNDWIAVIPELVANNSGEILYDGRNKIMQFKTPNGVDVVVKRYKRHDIFKQIAYSFFKPNKARRSFENAIALQAQGFNTPCEIAYIEDWSCGLLKQVYYVCEYTDNCAIRPELIEKEPFNRDLATAYAKFVAKLHDNGVLHRDLNPTNVLYGKNATGYEFELIDINRMCFYNGEVPIAECMENLTLFWWLTDVYRYVLDEYAQSRGWTSEDIAKAISVKQRHDKSWVRRKKFTGFLKQYILRK